MVFLPAQLWQEYLNWILNFESVEQGRNVTFSFHILRIVLKLQKTMKNDL